MEGVCFQSILSDIPPTIEQLAELFSLASAESDMRMNLGSTGIVALVDGN